MFNLLKRYSDLLNFDGMNEDDRKASLKRIFVRDIEENENLHFRNKRVRPVKGEEPLMQITFTHLITASENVQEPDGKTYTKRVYDQERSKRLHWILPHLEEGIEDIEVFSLEEVANGRNSIRTYVLNKPKRYVIILEPYRKRTDYYLITAYLLEPRNILKIEKKMKRKLDIIH